MDLSSNFESSSKLPMDILRIEESFSDSIFSFHDETTLYENLTPDDVMPAFYEPEPLYRSAALVSPSHFNRNISFDDHVRGEFFQIPVYDKKKISNATDCVFSGCLGESFNFQSIVDPQNNSSTKMTSHSCIEVREALVAPEVPYLLLPTHFEVKKSLIYIHEIVRSFLDECNGISYEFDPSRIEWTLMTFSGSKSCKLQIHIYAEINSFIVEANRLMGDSSKFRSFFNDLKSRFVSCEMDIASEFYSCTKATHSPESAVELSAEDISKGVDTILRMARAMNIEAQCEAAKALCDLTVNETLQVHLCDHNVVDTLRYLISESMDTWSKHHAMTALSNLTDSKTCIEAIVGGGVVPILMHLACDGSYDTAELRRLAAHVLAKLSLKVSKKIISALDKRELDDWIKTIDTINDERIKIPSIRAKDYLSSSILAF